MAIAMLRRYQGVVVDGAQKILHSRVGEEWQLKDPKDGRITAISLHLLRKKYEEGKLQFLVKDKLASDIAKELYKAEPRGKPVEVADEAWRLACAKMALVREVWGLSWTSQAQEERIRELWPKLTEKLNLVPLIPDATTVYRWWRKLEEYGWDARALLPQNHKKGRKRAELHESVLCYVEDGVDDDYLNQERHTKDSAHEAVCTLIRGWNAANPDKTPLKYPTKRQVFKYIEGLDAFDVCAARYGHDVAIRKFRAVKGSNVAVRPLQRVEFDHTVMDVIVLDDDTLLPLGRPTIAIAIDVFTRCIIGIYIGFEPPSCSTVGQCLKSALRPKQLLLEAVPNVAGTWPVYGQMEVLVIDQALENYATMIERMAACLGIEVAWRGRKMPWQKGAVERFMRTLNVGFCHPIAGTTRSNIQDKGEYDAVGRAVCTFSALKRALVIWIVDRYHCKWHRTLQMAPIGKWQTSISEDDIPLCADFQVIETFLRVPKQKPLTHKGIDCNSGLLYNSDDLTDLRRKHGAELPVTIYPSLSNLGSIIVEYAPKGFRETVNCLNPEYAEGLTIWQHKAIRKYAKEQSIGVATFDALLEARARLYAEIYEGMADSPLRTRVRDARMLQKTKELDAQTYREKAPPGQGDGAPHTQSSTGIPATDLDEFAGVELECF